MSLYQDPRARGRLRPDLFSKLLGQPAWDQHHQLENQASIALAWLADRSSAIARRLLDLWLEDPEVPQNAVIGARDQLIFPSKLRPDVSIDVSDRALQLLIEVKVGAEFAQHDGLMQDDAYRAEWARMESGEAKRRAVGTLTRDSTGLRDEVDLDGLRARDVEWRELKLALQDVAEGGELDSALRHMLDSYCNAIDLHLDVVTVDEAALPGFLERARPLVEKVGAEIGQALGSTPSVAHGAHYAGAKLSYEALDGNPVVVRIVAGAPGGAMTPIGAGETLLVGVGRDHSILLKDEDRKRALESGFDLLRTPQFTFTGVSVEFENARQNPSAITSRLLPALVSASMLPAGQDPEAAQKVGQALEAEYKGRINLPPGWRPTQAVELDSDGSN